MTEALTTDLVILAARLNAYWIQLLYHYAISDGLLSCLLQRTLNLTINHLDETTRTLNSTSESLKAAIYILIVDTPQILFKCNPERRCALITKKRQTRYLIEIEGFNLVAGARFELTTFRL